MILNLRMKMNKIKYMRLVLPIRYGEEDLPKFFPWRKDDILDLTYNIKTGEILNPENKTDIEVQVN